MPEKTVLWSRRPSYIGSEIGMRFSDCVEVRPENSPGAFQEHEPARVPHGQEAEHHLVHEAEDGRVGPDAEGQGQDHHGREARALGERPQREPHVLANHLHRASRR
jgi:hypothetical protein